MKLKIRQTPEVLNADWTAGKAEAETDTEVAAVVMNESSIAVIRRRKMKETGGETVIMKRETSEKKIPKNLESMKGQKRRKVKRDDIKMRKMTGSIEMRKRIREETEDTVGVEVEIKIIRAEAQVRILVGVVEVEAKKNQVSIKTAIERGLSTVGAEVGAELTLLKSPGNENILRAKKGLISGVEARISLTNGITVMARTIQISMIAEEVEVRKEEARKSSIDTKTRF